jgi:flagellar motor switch protein FliM
MTVAQSALPWNLPESDRAARVRPAATPLSQLSREQARALQALHAEFAGEAPAAFARVLPGATLTLLSLAETTHAARRACCSPACCVLGFSAAEPHAGTIECSREMTELLLRRLLGCDDALESSGLSEIEGQLLRGALEPVVAAYATAWRRHLSFRPRLEKAPRAWALDDALYLASYQLHTPQGDGEFTVALRLAAWDEPLRALAQEAAPTRPAANPALLSAIGDCELPTRALLGSTRLTVSELLGLRVGDMICLEREATAPIEIHVGTQPKLLGHAQVRNGQFVVTVDGPAAGRMA